MGKKSRLKDRVKDEKNDFLKRFTIKEHKDHVRFELTVDALKIIAIADLKEYQGEKALIIRYYDFSMKNHKYIYCIHLLVEYMRYYSELNKLPLIARLPHSDEAAAGRLSDNEKSRRLSLTNLYLDHEFQQMDDDPNTFLSVLDQSVHIPKKVDIMGIHYGSSNRTIIGNTNARRPPLPQTPVELPEEVPPAQD